MKKKIKFLFLKGISYLFFAWGYWWGELGQSLIKLWKFQSYEKSFFYSLLIHIFLLVKYPFPGFKTLLFLSGTATVTCPVGEI